MAGSDDGGLVRGLGLVSTTSLVVGSIVGSGIFLLPATVAGHLRDPGLVLLAWAVGGLLVLCGGLAMAELGAMYPRAGGQYVFLREAFGKPAAFLFGWMCFAMGYTGSIAAIAVAFAVYAATLVSMTPFAVKLAAVAVIWLLTIVNLFGVRQAGMLQSASTAAKLAAIGGLVVLAFVVGGGYVAPPQASVVSPAPGLLAGFGLALTAVLFAYDGFASATFVAGEVKDPSRTLPRATLLGIGIVILTYLAVNAAYLHVLPVENLAASPAVAFDVGRALLGNTGAQLFAAAVVVSTFGTVSAYVLMAPRIYYAMARDGLHYPGFGKLHARTRAPAFGLILQAEWASLLALSGTFEQLVTFSVISGAVFYAMTGVALFRLRRTAPEVPRPYRAWGYPLLPAFFVASTLLLVANQLAFDTFNALVGLALAASGVPVYLLLRARGLRDPSPPPNTDA